MNFRSKLSLFAGGVELRSELGDSELRQPLLVGRLQHFPAAQKPRRVPPRPVLTGSREYLRALRAAEMKAWEAGIHGDVRPAGFRTAATDSTLLPGGSFNKSQ